MIVFSRMTSFAQADEQNTWLTTHTRSSSSSNDGGRPSHPRPQREQVYLNFGGY
jgi:hypothetical protein